MPEFSPFMYYLIGINLLGFVLYIINMLLYRYTEEGQIDAVLTIVCLAFGSAGMLIAILLFDRKPLKENMMSRVFIACIFVTELIVLLFFKGYHGDTVNMAFASFFSEHQILLIYLSIINIIAFIAFGIDKLNAIAGRSRIRIITLLGIAFVGGSIGALIAMYAFRHKTRKDYFTVGIPLMIIMQIALIFFVMNNI